MPHPAPHSRRQNQPRKTTAMIKIATGKRIPNFMIVSLYPRMMPCMILDIAVLLVNMNEILRRRDFLSRYIASSAARKAASTSILCGSQVTTPEASALIVDTLFAEEVDAAQSLTQRRDIRLLCGRLLGATDDQNSSPPRRPTISSRRATAVSRCRPAPESCRRTDGRTDR